MGQVWEGTSPRWAGAPLPPHKGPRRLRGGKGANPKGVWALGPILVRPPLPLPSWPPPLSHLGLPPP